MRRALKLPLGALCVLLSSWSVAAGQDPALPLELVWEAPAQCPQQADIERDLARVARPREGYSVPTLEAHAQVQQHDDVYVLSLRTQRESTEGVRELRARSCAALARAASLVLALAFGRGVELVDALDETGPPTPAEPASQAEPMASSPAPAPPPPPPVAAARRREPRLQLGLAVAPVWGLLPAVGARLSAGLVWHTSRASLRVTASALVPKQRSHAAGGSQFESRYNGGSLRFTGCGHWPWQVTFEACGFAEAGVLHGRARRTESDAARWAPRYALGPSLWVGFFANAWLWLGLGGELGVQLARPRFVVEGAGTVHQMERLTAAVSVALRVGL